jgi:hypothetical protein
MMVNMIKLGFVSKSQRSDQDIEIQMEVNLGEPFIVRKINTRIDFVTMTKTRANLVIEIGTNMIEVEEVVSLIDPAHGCDFVAQDSTPLTF